MEDLTEEEITEEARDLVRSLYCLWELWRGQEDTVRTWIVQQEAQVSDLRFLTAQLPKRARTDTIPASRNPTPTKRQPFSQNEGTESSRSPNRIILIPQQHQTK